MDADEREIYTFLKTWGTEMVSYREIARRAGGKRRFHKDPDWAKPLLVRMVERGILENDSSARYRLKPVATKDKKTRWVAPEIAKLLKAKGVQVESATVTEIASEEYYHGL